MRDMRLIPTLLMIAVMAVSLADAKETAGSKPAGSGKKAPGPATEDAEKFSYYLGCPNGKIIAANPINPMTPRV